MGWREILGATPGKVHSERHMQKVQNMQKVSKGTPERTFAPSAPIVPNDEMPRAEDTVPETTPIVIEKMSVCLHGSWCRFISCNGWRQICQKNRQPIFDMTVCPEDKWWRVQH